MVDTKNSYGAVRFVYAENDSVRMEDQMPKLERELAGLRNQRAA